MCMLFLALSITVILPEDKIVEAETSPTTYPIDFQYIKEIANNLSVIINNTDIYPDGELAKGRFFGSKGEKDAAGQIAIEMEELGLWDPTKNNDQNPPYRERIQNIDFKQTNLPEKHFFIYYFMSNWGKLKEITEVLERRFNIIEQEGNPELVDCFISPKIYNVSSYPWWFKESLQQSKNKDFLTYNYSYDGLKIIRTDNYTCTDDFLSKANITIYSHFTRYNITSENVKVFNNHQISTMLQLLRPLIRSHTFRSINPLQKAFEKHYNFKFRTMNTNKSSTWPDFLEQINDVDEGFVFIEECPLFNPNISELPSLEGSDDYNEFYWWTRMIRSQYQELRMKAWAKAYPKCKGLIWYDYLNDSYDTGFTGSYLPIIYINKTIGWKLYNNTEDYTVGFWMNQSLNETVESYNVIGQINGSNKNKTAIIGCLYDSMWCQGTTDSATGVGIMLAIAKYFKQNEITPKYNLRFIAYGGEEVGMRGAMHYEFNHSNNITAVIDLNQFGFNQSDVNTTFNIVTNDLDSVTKLDYISSLTNYVDRAPEDANVSELKTYSIPMGSLSDDWIFAFARIARPLQNRDLKTVLFLRDSNWYRHHRDGMDHTEGDSMDYFLDDDVNLVAELIYNITKFYTVNPNCWFKSIDHELWDSPNDNNDVPDAINVSFTLKTSIPSDRVRIKAYLQNNLHKERNISEYVISSDSEYSGYINFSLPAEAPIGEYTLYVYLFNSTGTVKGNFYAVLDDAHHWVRDEKFANDTYKKLDFYVGGCNDLANPTNQLTSSTQNMKAGTSYTYTTSATEPNNEQVYYQFKWTSHSLEHEYSSWYGPYASGVNCTVPHIWTSAGNMEVRVRSRDKWFAPGGWSNWSDPLNITSASGCAIFTNSTTVLLNKQINFSGEKYDFDFSGPSPSWNWSFGNGNTSTTQNTSQTYNATGDYTVNLTLENDTSKVYYEIVVHVVNLSADFSVSQNSIQSNETLSFTDLSEGINNKLLFHFKRKDELMVFSLNCL